MVFILCCTAMSRDTLGFLESSWNRGILSRMAKMPDRPLATMSGIGVAEPCGLIAIAVRYDGNYGYAISDRCIWPYCR